ncbi:MAG: EamA family transporter [Christensenellaceae bacterium]|nr:EamA family transporter [Christensenellaceae bacterium]
MSEKKGTLLVSLAAAFWGLLPLFTRVIYAGGGDPFSVASMRALTGGLAFLVIGLFKGSFRGVSAKRWLIYAAMGIFASGGMYIFYPLSIAHVSTAVAAVLLYTAPAFVIIFSRIFYKEPITRGKAIALAMTFAGCALVVRIYDISSLVVSGLGILFGLLSGITYSLVTVIGRKALGEGDPLQASVLPAMFTLLMFQFIRPVWSIDLSSAGVDLCYLALGLLCGATPMLLYLSGMKGIEGGKASLIATLEPVVATLVGAFVLGDRLEWLQVVGMVIVLGGTYIPTFFEKTKKF